MLKTIKESMANANVWVYALTLMLFAGFTIPSVAKASLMEASCEMTEGHCSSDHDHSEHGQSGSKSGCDSSDCQINCFSSQSISVSSDIHINHMFSVGRLADSSRLPAYFLHSTPERPPQSL